MKKKFAQLARIEFSCIDEKDIIQQDNVVLTNLPEALACALLGIEDNDVCFYTESLDKEYLLKNFDINLEKVVYLKSPVKIKNESIYSETRSDFFDEEELCYCIDAWKTCDDDEEGEVVARVYIKDYPVVKGDLDKLTDPLVAEDISLILNEAKIFY